MSVPTGSPLVVISWWSNCLGLACLQRLAAYAPDWPVYVVQVGKSAVQQERFRQYMPPAVQELPYPADAPGEHSRVIADVVSRQLPSLPGLWFVDHDVFLQADWRGWLAAADAWFNQSGLCLCLPWLAGNPAITQPAFWLSPARWPADLSFDPIPFRAQPVSRRPDLYRHDGALHMPQQDTLVQAQRVLEEDDGVGWYSVGETAVPHCPLPPFPQHSHLGGLYLFAGPILPPAFDDWMQATVTRFSHFFAHCPAEWLAAEDPVLLQRLDNLKDPFMPETQSPLDFANFPRRDLTFKYTRRGLLTTITTEIEVSAGREQGGAGYRLARLGSLPDEALAQVVPGVIPGCQIALADGYVWGQPPPTNRRQRLFKAEPAALFVFNQFNGRNTLNDITARLCEETGWEAAHSFAFARGLFLHLVQERICLPA